MFKDYFEKMSKEEQVVAKENGNCQSISFSVDIRDTKATAIVSNLIKSNKICVRVCQVYKGTKSIYEVCNDWNSHSTGTIAFAHLTPNNDTLILTRTFSDSEDFDKVVGANLAELLVELEYVTKQ